jgi:cytochrome c oxidase cbb3-type subunit 3
LSSVYRKSLSRTTLCSLFMVAIMVLSLSSCKRERRDFDASPPAAATVATRVSALRPGPIVDTTPVPNPYEDNAYARSQGQLLFAKFNCTGCHAHGGGGQGPALMDSLWIYGSDPDQIFATIVEGRPNGMPSFRGKLTTNQVWQLTAYVRSLSGLGRRDVRPARQDNMYTGSSPQNTHGTTPRNSGIPPESEMP